MVCTRILISWYSVYHVVQIALQLTMFLAPPCALHVRANQPRPVLLVASGCLLEHSQVILKGFLVGTAWPLIANPSIPQLEGFRYV